MRNINVAILAASNIGIRATSHSLPHSLPHPNIGIKATSASFSSSFFFFSFSSPVVGVVEF